jgi:hypothetical protein
MYAVRVCMYTYVGTDASKFHMHTHRGDPITGQGKDCVPPLLLLRLSLHRHRD